MNKVLFALVITLLFSQASFADPTILKKSNNISIGQFFTPDPSKSQVPASMTGTKVFKKSPSAADLAAGMIDWTDVVCMTVNPTGASTYYLNDDTTKTKTLRANVDNFIGIAHNTTKVTLTLGAATAEIQGMTND